MLHSEAGAEVDVFFFTAACRVTAGPRVRGAGTGRTAGKGSDAPPGRGRFPASSSQSGMCAAVTAQSGTIIGAGAALDCQGGVPLLCAPALQFQSGTRISVMPLGGAKAECGEGNCRSSSAEDIE